MRSRGELAEEKIQNDNEKTARLGSKRKGKGAIYEEKGHAGLSTAGNFYTEWEFLFLNINLS